MGVRGAFLIVEFAVLDDERLTIYDRAVYFALLRFADHETRECFPAHATLARLAGCSERQVRISLSKLDACGWISRRGRIGESTVYTVRNAAQRSVTPASGAEVMETTPAQSAEVRGENDATPASHAEVGKGTSALSADHPGTRCRLTISTELDKEEGEGGNTPVEIRRPETLQEEQRTAFCRSVLDVYGRALPENPPAKYLTPGRKKAIEERIRAEPERRLISWWRDFFARAASFSVVTGGGPRGWRADVDWLLREENMAKVLEGRLGRRAESIDEHVAHVMREAFGEE